MNWDEMTPRQRDAWAFEKVLGWPAELGINYSTVEADYEVLKKVREEWTKERQNEFLRHLIQPEFLDHQTPFGQTGTAILNYQPGDYSHAAWMVLGEKDDASKS